MKFIHMADMHFDAPFSALSAREGLGEVRRLEQRQAFKTVIEYIKKNDVSYLFIPGDFYEHDYIRESTIEYINDLFKEIPKCKVFIAPGNHDPYLNNSYYKNYTWAPNVHIFKSSKIEKVSDDNINIYGMGFTDFYMERSPIDNMKIEPSPLPNILVAHADLNGSRDENGLSYNPVSESKLKDLDFDYVALGHIHKNNLKDNNKIVYPGSTISFGFDELGAHGIVVGNVEKGKLETEFIDIDDREFEEIVINVGKFKSEETLLDYILDLQLQDNHMYKLVLSGRRKFEINAREFLKVVTRSNILKIKDLTKIAYEIDSLGSENNLKGLFIREIREKQKSGLFTDEEIEKAIEIGLSAME